MSEQSKIRPKVPEGKSRYVTTRQKEAEYTTPKKP